MTLYKGLDLTIESYEVLLDGIKSLLLPYTKNNIRSRRNSRNLVANEINILNFELKQLEGVVDQFHKIVNDFLDLVAGVRPRIEKKGIKSPKVTTNAHSAHRETTANFVIRNKH